MPLQIIGGVIFAASYVVGFLFHFFAAPAILRKAPYKVFGHLGGNRKDLANKSICEIYVPLGDDLYKDEKEFMKINDLLTEDFRRKLYRTLIVTGAWKSLCSDEAAGPVQVSPAEEQNRRGSLLIRFSIDALTEQGQSAYGMEAGKLIGQAVPAELLEGMSISDGDSAATLQGKENVYIVSIAGPDLGMLKDTIEPLILSNEAIGACAARPVTQIVSDTSEPLVTDGIVQAGRIAGNGGFCAVGFERAWGTRA